MTLDAASTFPGFAPRSGLLGLRLRRRSLLALGPTSRFRVDAFGKRLAAGRAVPFFVRLVGDLARHQELRELAALCLALERHSAMLCLSPSGPDLRWRHPGRVARRRPCW